MLISALQLSWSFVRADVPLHGTWSARRSIRIQREGENADDKATVVREASQNVFYVAARVEDINLK
jgi:hypothetical protein